MMNLAINLLKRFWPDLVVMAILMLLAAWAYQHGVAVGAARTAATYQAQMAERDRAAAKAMEDALVQARSDAAMAMAAERASLQAQAKAENQFKTITQTVTKYVDTHPDTRTCGLDADGLRIWNSANRAATAQRPAARP